MGIAIMGGLKAGQHSPLHRFIVHWRRQEQKLAPVHVNEAPRIPETTESAKAICCEHLELRQLVE